MEKIIIAIDGYSSCGKSTLAKQLANELQYTFIDSGAMYRAITLYFLRNKINREKKSEVIKALSEIHLQFFFNTKEGKSDMFLNGENVAQQIREMLINENVSEVAAIKEVREFAVFAQQKMGLNKAIVMDGRDIGTTVFPNAELKIFMTADICVRVERRFKEMYEKNKNISLEEVKANLEMRDYIDTNRMISPLRKAGDAMVLDNSNLTIREQLNISLGWMQEKINS